MSAEHGYVAGGVLLFAIALLALTRTVFSGSGQRWHLLAGMALAARPGPLHRASPRLKLALLFTLALTAAMTPLERLWVPAGVLLAACLISGLRLRLVVARSFELAPFVVLAAVGTLMTGELRQFALLLGRALIVMTSLVLLMATTRFPALVGAARRLGCPLPLVSMFALAVRYLAVLLDEGARMGLAFSARAVGPRDLRLVRPLGRVVGCLAIRSLDRGERIHQAMLARGFTGELPCLADEDRLDPAQLAVAMMIAGLLGLAAWWPAP